MVGKRRANTFLKASSVLSHFFLRQAKYEAHIIGNKKEKVDSRTIRTYQSGPFSKGKNLI